MQTTFMCIKKEFSFIPQGSGQTVLTVTLVPTVDKTAPVSNGSIVMSGDVSVLGSFQTGMTYTISAVPAGA